MLALVAALLLALPLLLTLHTLVELLEATEESHQLQPIYQRITFYIFPYRIFSIS